MKVFVGLLFLLSTSVLAEEPPKFLKDATILVTLKDGSTATFSANQWKVVPRLDKAKKSVPVKEEDLKNRFRVVGGVGFDGFDSKDSGNKTTVESTRTGVFGIGYARKLNKRFSLGGQIISNGTYTLDVGVDF